VLDLWRLPLYAELPQKWSRFDFKLPARLKVAYIMGAEITFRRHSCRWLVVEASGSRDLAAGDLGQYDLHCCRCASL